MLAALMISSIAFYPDPRGAAIYLTSSLNESYATFKIWRQASSRVRVILSDLALLETQRKFYVHHRLYVLYEMYKKDRFP